MKTNSKGFKNANGIKLYYEIYGEGKPLVLIHGGGSSGFFDFEETIKRMSDDFKLILIDLQNHGRSEHRDIPETFDQDASDIMVVLDQLNIDKAMFFGSSNGATTAMKIAHQFPERVEKLIFASGNTSKNGLIDGFFDNMLASTVNDMPEYLKSNFLKLNPDLEKFQNMFEKDSQRMVHFQDFEDGILENINSPVFLIAGDRDIVKAEHFVEMNHKIPDSRLMILPATHGNYLIADENGKTETELIDFTINQIKNFLTS